MGMVSNRQKDEAIANFRFEGVLIDERPYGSGHINDTFLLTFDISGMGLLRVILQRMNKEIFTQPEELMENVLGVTSYLRKKIIENGGDPERETLNIIRTVANRPYYVDSQGDYWRCYKFIDGATSYDQVEKPDDFIRAQYLSVTSRDCLQTIRQRLFTRRSKDSMIQRHVLKCSKKQWKQMCADV